jgi:SAM-dependent methyltransferase
MKMNEWDQVFIDCGSAKPEYDSWLCKFGHLLQLSDDYPVIDVGCGFGNDTLYLFEKGYRVISCDYSLPALRRLHCFISKPRPVRFNFLDGLPFANESVKIVIADLSLHYFDTERTISIIKDCQRIIKRGGKMICRVNSTKDYNHGAGQGTK